MGSKGLGTDSAGVLLDEKFWVSLPSVPPTIPMHKLHIRVYIRFRV